VNNSILLKIKLLIMSLKNLFHREKNNDRLKYSDNCWNEWSIVELIRLTESSWLFSW